MNKSMILFVRTSNASGQVITADSVNVELLVTSANRAFQHFFRRIQRFDIWKKEMSEWISKWMNEWMIGMNEYECMNLNDYLVVSK